MKQINHNRNIIYLILSVSNKLYAIMKTFSLTTIVIILLSLTCVSSFCGSDDGYSMYVWTNGFNATAPYCNGVFPPSKIDPYDSCFYHNWESPVARQHLWASAKIPGREVTRIFLSDVYKRIKNDGFLPSSTECDEDLLSFLRETHERGIKVYGLFAASDEEFSETWMAKFVHQFNTKCGDNMAYFDGVSVNNEYFSQVKSCTTENEAAQLKFLTDLNTTATNSKPLPLHFSVSWNWECCDCSDASYQPRELTWNGETKTALAHMIDIVDSVDVQVAYNVPEVMTDRGTKAHGYWENKMYKTPTSALYILAYTNPNSLCQLSFSPHKKGSETPTDFCSKGNRTEAGLFAAFDHVEDALPGSIGGIHYMSGVFSTGMSGWPKHDSKNHTCPLSQMYNKKKAQCVNKCRKGKVWQPKKCNCKCPSKCKRITESGKCKPRCKNELEKWDPIGQNCIPITSVDVGYIWNKTTKKCNKV